MTRNLWNAFFESRVPYCISTLLHYYIRSKNFVSQISIHEFLFIATDMVHAFMLSIAIECFCVQLDDWYMKWTHGILNCIHFDESSRKILYGIVLKHLNAHIARVRMSWVSIVCYAMDVVVVDVAVILLFISFNSMCGKSANKKMKEIRRLVFGLTCVSIYGICMRWERIYLLIFFNKLHHFVSTRIYYLNENHFADLFCECI